MERTALARRILEVSKLTGRFTLRSGKVSDTYFDKYLFESDPLILRSICKHMQALVPGSTEILCGLELGGVPVVTVLSQLCGLPAAFVRKERKQYGTCKYAEGPGLAGRNILIVEDVVSSGGAILNSVRMLREDGVSVDRAVCVIDRRPEGANELADNGVSLESVFRIEEIEHAA